MAEQIRFDDGAAYEDFMGQWSQSAGMTFLDWLAPSPQLHWVDVGCGNGAFTELLVEHFSASRVQGIDPSSGQIDFARKRLSTNSATFQVGDAMALSFADDSFDAAVMALVIFFVPEPSRGVAEMTRVVKPGGSVSAYAWDFLAGGFPYAAVNDELVALGSAPLAHPSIDASRIDVLRDLWAGAGLEHVETRSIAVQRTFADFDTFWKIARVGPPFISRIASLTTTDLQSLQDRLRARLASNADGSITYSASANAVKGTVPR